MLCQGPGNRSLSPAELAESGGQDTVERHCGLDVLKEKIVQREQENPASNGREVIDDFRLRGSSTWRRMNASHSHQYSPSCYPKITQILLYSLG